MRDIAISRYQDENIVGAHCRGLFSSVLARRKRGDVDCVRFDDVNYLDAS